MCEFCSNFEVFSYFLLHQMPQIYAHMALLLEVSKEEKAARLFTFGKGSPVSNHQMYSGVQEALKC